MKNAIILSLALAVTVSAWGADFEVKGEYDWSGGEKAKTISIENANGDISVKAGGSMVSFKAVKEATTQEYLDAIKIRIEDKGDSVKINVEYPRHENAWGKANKEGGRVDFDITVPDGVYVVVELANGGVATDDVSELKIELANGDIEVKGAYEKAEVNLANGSVDIDNPDRATAYLDVNVANGDIDAAFALPESGGDFDFGAVNGEIVINLLGDANNFSLDAGTITGNVTADFPLESEKGWVGGEYWAKVGGGDNVISADVISGTIDLKTK